MKPQVVRDMPALEYHGRTEFLSNSMLTQFLRSPAHLQAYLRNPPEQTKALADGVLIHDAILEPQILSKKYVASPDPANFPGALVSGDDLKAKCKELGLPVSGTKAELGKRILEKDPKAVIWDRVLEEYGKKHSGKTFIKADELRDLEQLVESVYSHESASRLLSGGFAEASVFWKDQASGVQCRCRPDYYIQKEGILVDVKSTEDARLWAFERSIFTFGYYRQMALYSMGLEAAGFPVKKCRIIAVEKSEPYAVNVFELDSVSLAQGAREVQEGLRQYAECLKSGNWPAYSEGISMASLPKYAFG